MANFRLSQLDPIPKIKNVEVDRTIGQGAFALVKRAHLAKNRAKVFAVKFIHLGYSKRSGLSEQQIGQEILLHKACSGHPNIIRMMEYGADVHWLWIAMELAPGGDLFDKIEPDYGVDEEVAHFYFRQLISAVEFIHQKGVAHRDIKPENILLDASGNLKLADFGLAAVYRSKSGKRRQCMTPCGSPPYMAPEVASMAGYDPTGADLWSCGIVLYVLLTGQTPWEEPTLEDADFAAFVEHDGKVHAFPWNRFDPAVLSLLRSLLKPDPARRVAVENLRKHLWINRSNVFTDDLSGLCTDTTALTARLLSGLHIGLDDDTASDEALFSTYNREQLSHSGGADGAADGAADGRVASTSQPVVDISAMVDDEELLGQQQLFPATQQYHTEHSKKKRRLASGGAAGAGDEAILEAISRDPAALQFMDGSARHSKLQELQRIPHAKNLSLFGERLTRFFSTIPLQTLVSTLFDALHRMGVKTRTKNETDLVEQYRLDDAHTASAIFISLTTLDRRKLPLKGSIKVSRVMANSALRKVEFLKSKGDPLEWRKFFKTCTVLCKDVVYVDEEAFGGRVRADDAGDSAGKEVPATPATPAPAATTPDRHVQDGTGTGTATAKRKLSF